MLYHTQNPHGGDVYDGEIQLDFSANTNPYGTPQPALDAMSAVLTRVHQYPDPYCRELVKAISEFESVRKEWILCGSGAAELIYSYCEALRPQKAMELAPTFSEYSLALERAGCRVELYPLKKEHSFSLTEDFLPVLESSRPDVLFLCNPNNPTGQVIEKSLLEQILSLCERKGIFLFVDECFLDLTEGGEGLTLKDRLGQNENLLLLKAFTKSYGMAGLRLGCCLSGNARLLLAMSRDTQAWNVSIPAQAAGAAALKEQAFLERARNIIFDQRPRMAAAMESLGLTVIPSRANFLLFYSEKELYAPLLARGIQLRSCDNFPGLGRGWYRAAVKLPEENRILLSAMEEILHG